MARGATRGVSEPGRFGTVASGEDGDRRAALPPLGLREYWYPALPARRVGRKKPVFWKMLGEELAFFRNDEGQVSAVSDVCPHRGASMSQGDCFYAGTITCPYHGATFDKSGECVAFLTEGPDSKMTGNLRIRTYPTRELRGWVFVWMGESEPAPIEDDVPPELFEEDPRSVVLTTYTYWASSWIVAIENQNDAHNAFFVHRNSLMQLTAPRGRARTPVGPRSRLVEDRALLALGENQTYYRDENGELPYQMYYEGVDGVWPLHKWRRWVWNAMAPVYKHVLNPLRSFCGLGEPFETPQEWSALNRSAGGSRSLRTSSSWHLPCAVRVNFGHFMYTRWAVPVDENTSRVVYFHSRRVTRRWSPLVLRAWFYAYFNYWIHYNFSGQDADAVAPCRYWTEENLAATDSHLILLRKLITERSRDAKLGRLSAGITTTKAEERSFERQRESGLIPEIDFGSTAAPR